MSTKQPLRRTVSLVLALAVMLWAGAVPAMSSSLTYVHACRMSQSAMHGTQLSSHHCCPRQIHTSSSLPEPIVFTAVALCYQDCCAVRSHPARGFTFLARDGRPSADTFRISVTATATPSATTFERRTVSAPRFTKAVFDLKADLRI